MYIPTLQKPFPFELSVGGSVLHCQSLLRTLPDSYLVIAGKWQEKAVVAKIFLQPFPLAWLAFKREMKGTKRLLAAGIMTPAILHAERLTRSGAFIILFEHLPQTVAFRTRFEKTTSHLERLTLLREWVQSIAQQHQAGIMQIDLPIKNLVYANSMLYTVNTASIRAQKKPLSIQKSVKYFAAGLAELSFIDEPFRAEAIDGYLQRRGFPQISQIHQAIHREVTRCIKKRERKLPSSLLRTSAQFISEKNANYFWVCQQSYLNEEFRYFLQAPEQFLTSPQARIIKTDKTTTVAAVPIADKWFVIKRYNVKSKSYRLKRTLTQTRAKKSWKSAHRLLFRGISTPPPVAMMEERRGALKGVSYFVCEYIAGTTASAYFTPHNIDLKEGRGVAREVLKVLNQLYVENISHGDLKASNILLNEKSVFLIDLDAMRFHRNSYYFNFRTKKDKNRFMRNWQEQPMIRELFE
jgi:tRNA A-37 threonylcarbamoyl transferase component Bud32